MPTREAQSDSTAQIGAAKPAQDDLCLGNPVFKTSGGLAGRATQSIAQRWRAVFLEHGRFAPATVQGEFAVVCRAGDRTYLAVDRFGIRTLCYRQVGNELRFSERAVDLADETSEIDPQAIFDYLFFHVIPSPRTIFKDIFRLPPGHCGVFEGNQLTIAPYWAARFDEVQAKPFEKLRDEFRAVLADAVKSDLAAVEPGAAACFLSGGTDSSTIAGMIGQVTGSPASTYSIGFDATGYDEMAYARIASKHFKTKHHEYYVTPEDLVRGIPAVANHYDQPFGNSSSLPAYYCAKMAQADGIQKILAGDGGDELFGGNSRYAMQRVFAWYGAVPAGVRGLIEPVVGLPAMRKLPLLRKVAGYVGQAKVPMPDRLQMYNLLLRLGIDQVLTSDFLAQVDIESPARQQREVWAQADAASAINRTLAFDWRYTLAENDLRKVCGTAELAGVDVGFPFLGQRVLDFSLGLPPEYKLKGLKLRWFFKEALRGFLPDEIIKKRKQGFGLPFGVWTTQHAGLRRFAEDSLDSLAGRGIVRPDFIARLISELLPLHPGYYGEMVWILMMLEQWLQHHAPDYTLPAG